MRNPQVEFGYEGLRKCAVSETLLRKSKKHGLYQSRCPGMLRAAALQKFDLP